MQEGSFRCDANVSVRPRGQERFGTRAEIKNLNSFRFVEKAIQYEIARQIELIESGGKVVQETRLYDSDKQRDALDALQGGGERLPLFPGSGPAAARVRPAVHRCRAGHPARTAGREGRAVRARFRAVRLRCRRPVREPRTRRVLRGGRRGVGCDACEARGQLGHGRAVERAESRQCGDHRVARLAHGIEPPVGAHLDATISGKIAKDVFEAMWSEGRSADAIIEAQGLKQITDSRRDRGRDRRRDRRQSRSSSPIIAPARTSCSGSSSGKS